MGRQTKRSHSSLSGHEPAIGGGDRPVLTGFEPLLGGLRRAGIDDEQFVMLITSVDPRRKAAVLEHIIAYGQSPLYAQALADIVPPRARRKEANYTVNFTPSQRINALEVLAIIGGEESILAVIETMDDSNYPVRDAASKTIQMICQRLDPQLSSTVGIYRMLVIAMGDVKLAARKVIAQILAQSPADQVLGPLLFDGLTSDKWEIRRESAWVLGTIGDIRATKKLLEAIDDPSSAVRSSVVWALGHLDAFPVIAPLIDVAQGDDDDVVRAAAIEALGEHIARLDAAGEDPRPTINIIADALVDRDLPVRLAAAEALNNCGVAEARTALNRFLKNPRPPEK